MSSKYSAVNAYEHSVSQNVIEREKNERHNISGYITKPFPNGYLFDDIEKRNKINIISYSGNENEPLNNRNEKEATNKNVFDVLNRIESNNYKKYDKHNVTTSFGSTEADSKRKRINEIIEKYRNRMKKIHGQNSSFKENINDMEQHVSTEINTSEVNNASKYNKIDENNRIRVNEERYEKGIELLKKGKTFEHFGERDIMPRNTTVSNEDRKDDNIYMNKKSEVFIKNTQENKNGIECLNLKGFEQERKIKEKYEILGDLNKNHIYKNVTKDGQKNGFTYYYNDHINNDSLHSDKEKKVFNMLVKEREEFNTLPLDQKKRNYLDIERANQIDYKKELFLKSQGDHKMKNNVEEQTKIENNKIEKIPKEKDEDIYSFRHFLYDSIAFDELKIKDKFKEIEQIEQSIKAKNLLSTTPVITGEDKINNDMKINNECKEDTIEKEKNIDTFYISESKERGIITDTNNMKADSGKVGYKSLYTETFCEKPIKEEKKEKDAVSEKEIQEKKIFQGSLYMKKPYEENKLENPQNENILKKHIGYHNKKIEKEKEKEPEKEMEEEDAYYKNFVSLNKPDFSLKHFGNKKEKQNFLVEHKNGQIKKNKITEHYDEKGNSNEIIKKYLFCFDEKEENKFLYKKTEEPRYVKENGLKKVEEKGTSEMSSYCNGDKLKHIPPTKDYENKNDNINSKILDYEKTNPQLFSLLNSKIEKKTKTEDEIQIVKSNVSETNFKKNSLNNVNQNNLRNELKQEVVKENIKHFSSDYTVDDLKEKNKFHIKEKKKHDFLFSNNYTQDRKLERTIKTAYTEQVSDREFQYNNSDNHKKLNYAENEHFPNSSEKYKNERSDLMKKTEVIDISDKKTKHGENNDVKNCEMWETSCKYQNINNTKEKENKNIQEINSVNLEERKHLNKDKNKLMEVNISRSLHRDANMDMLDQTYGKMHNVLSKTYYNNLRDNSQLSGNFINRESIINKKYEKDYKFLEQLKNNLEKENQENQLFFSVNYSQMKNKTLSHKKFPNGLYVTYNDHSTSLNKPRSNIIKDKVFDDFDNEKEGKIEIEKTLDVSGAKDKQGSIDLIKKELEIIKRNKVGNENGEIDEDIIKDEINEKRKLYEEKIRKEFEEKIQKRIQMFDQKKKEKTQILEENVHQAGNVIQNEQTEQRKQKKERCFYEIEKRKKEKRKKNLFDDYSSDGSYYRRVYRNLYDDEYNKKLKNYFYDVSDNFYLHDCSDIFFDNVKNTPSNDVALSSSFDTELISLSKINFDEFDYNYLNKRGKSNSSKSEQKKKTIIDTTPRPASSKESSYITSQLKKPQFEFSDVSEKESLKCENDMIPNVTTPKRKLSNVLVEEKENNILCKLVKRKTMDNEVSYNKNVPSEENTVLNDLYLKENIKDDVVSNEVVINKEVDFVNNNKQGLTHNKKEESDKELFGKLHINTIVEANEIKKNELSEHDFLNDKKMGEEKVEIGNNSLKKKNIIIRKKIPQEKSPIEHINYKIPVLEKTNLDKTQGKKIPLERKISKNSNTNSNHDNINNVDKRNIKNPIRKETRRESKRKSDIQKVALQEKTKEIKLLTTIEDIKNIKDEKEKNLDEVKEILKEPSESSTKTIPKINILQNKENYIPLDLALNFVMDNQKMKKQVKKEIKRPNKKKTFTQWVMEERKKRLKNNLPIDI